MPLKVFISNIDSELGRELVELFRNDHVCIDAPNVILGTGDTPAASGIYRSLNVSAKFMKFRSNPNIVIRAAMECDVVVLDLRQQSPENELIIKYLAECTPRRNNRIVAVSSLLTWANCTSQECAFSAESREQVPKNIIEGAHRTSPALRRQRKTILGEASVLASHLPVRSRKLPHRYGCAARLQREHCDSWSTIRVFLLMLCHRIRKSADLRLAFYNGRRGKQRATDGSCT